MKRPQREVEINKAAVLAVTVNALELVLIVGVILYLLWQQEVQRQLGAAWAVLLLALVMVATGAVLDIRDAVFTRRLSGQLDDMNEAVTAMESLNNTLRAQRHDFLNHLQVVYSLMELEDYGEASAYIEKVYGSITSVSKVMRTAQPAVNALLQVKLAACGKQGIQVSTSITSSWKDLPMPGWEMCKVLSNLLDNAMEALEKVEDPRLELVLTEDLHAYRFSVANNGPEIPEALREEIFRPGITTKLLGEGHGMGLAIVRETLENAGGGIRLECAPDRVCFEGWVPRAAAVKEEA